MSSPAKDHGPQKTMIGAPRSSLVFLLQGNGSLLNRGCEAILESTVGLVRSAFGEDTRFINAPASWIADTDVRREDPSVRHSYPAPIRRFRANWLRYQYQLRIRKDPLAMAALKMTVGQHVHESDITLALGGDTYTLDYGVPRVYFAANRFTLDAGKPLILWGATIGPFSKHPEFEREAADQLKRVSWIYAREPMTVDYLRELGVTENVSLSSDTAFALELEKPLLSNSLQEALSTRCIGLNLSALAGRYRANPATWAQDAVVVTEALLRGFPDHRLVLVPHVFLPGNNDYFFMRGIVDQLRNPERVLLIAEPYSARELKWVLAQMQAFVGARTHATIAALSSQVPTLSIGYSRKAEGINLEMFGHTDWVVPIRQLAPELLCRKVGDLLEQRDSVARALRTQTTKARAIVAEATRDLGRFLRTA